ncbi:uncharacterized protein LOC117784338 isoform X2 [Drosophila innubila]|uniref:uncharacterized protein LOC117784338 isoform X2 n=1 Tax=Drosophila innubila TaxID=198719 RepID=UPI00148BCC44|nr:uncharacterized protein LOC117784338 isoform X2 [Drosophila innubila]
MQTESQEKASIDDQLMVRDGQLNGQSRKHNNNHHVVPLGILIALSTIYLMIAGLQINYNYYFKSGVEAVKISKLIDDSRQENVFLHFDKNNFEQPLCMIIDVFTMKVTNESVSEPPNKRQKIMKSTKRFEYGPTGIGGKQSKTLRAAEGNRKKDVSKKPNTAEPIIYLFALVFIYLLLKAASDINQHYKSNKGDKRLRRCSLQSYAQKDQRNHQDRRASKVAPMLSRHITFTEARSVSLDRYRYNNAGALHKMRKQITIGDHSRSYQGAGNLNLGNPIISSPEPRSSRRLSVPISINYQTVNVSPIVHPELARRGSVISLGSSADLNIVTGTNTLPLTAIAPDTKRRVRMINRH